MSQWTNITSLRYIFPSFVILLSVFTINCFILGVTSSRWLSVFILNVIRFFSFINIHFYWRIINHCFMFFIKYSKYSWISDKECDSSRNSNLLFHIGADILKSDSQLPKKLFYFLQWKTFTNDEKCFLFHSKSSFCSQDI